MQEDIKLTEIEKKYINRPIEEESFSFEVFKKLDSIRSKNEDLNREAKKRLESYVGKKEIKKGDRVKFKYRYKRKSFDFIGTVVCVKKSKGIKPAFFSIENQIGIFKDLTESGNQIQTRAILDYSSIDIPKGLKEINTKRLLRDFRGARAVQGYDGIYDYELIDWDNHVSEINTRLTAHVSEKFLIRKDLRVTVLEMRAELSTREHILTKFEKKIQRKINSKK